MATSSSTLRPFPAETQKHTDECCQTALPNLVPPLETTRDDENIYPFLEKVEIEVMGITHPSVPSNLHPSEAEITH